MSFLVDFFASAGADIRVVESVHIASQPVCHTVGLTKPATQLKRVSARGQGASRLMTCLHVCKVMHVVSPSPEATTTAPPVAGLTQMAQLPLFKEPALSGGDEVEQGGPVSSGKCPSPLSRCALTNSSLVFGTPVLLKWKANNIAVNAPPLPPHPALPLPVPNDLIMTVHLWIGCVGCSSLGHGIWTLCTWPRWLPKRHRGSWPW